MGVTVSSVTSDAATLSAVAVLADDLRRRMYTFIRQAGRPVSRDEAAAAAGISRKLAAFHLDKMVDAGLLQASYARPVSLRRAGRTPKLYAPAGTEVQISIPPREHALLAAILIDAVITQAPEEDSHQAVLRVAARSGRQAGLSGQARARPGRLGTERALTLACDALERHGFEPVRAAPTCVWLRNCPFQPLAARAPDLVCGINQAFWAGYLDGLGAATTSAVLAPRPGACCVELRAASPSRPPPAEPGP